MMYDELIKSLRFCVEEGACRQCKFDNDMDCYNTLMAKAADAIEDLITALTASNKVIAKNKPKWIPVTERLPEPEGHHEYIVCVKHFNPEYKRNVLVTTAEFEARVVECGEGPYWDGHNDGITRVTHWMPLPQPPESEGE